MDEIGAEVSQKIRSAIKAKLMELGAYVDEELPDYIMVMVANRRSREQMEDDLQLFLGSNTEEFTGWLHQVLQKLQEVTVANLERKRKASTGDSEGENIKKEKRRKSSERKKVRRASEQTRGKDAKGDSENVNQHSGKHMELEKLAKSCLDQSVSSDELNGTVTNEYIGKAEVRTGREHNDKIISLSHNLGSTKAVDTQINSDSELSHSVRKDSSKLHGDQGNIKSTQKSDETHSGISGCKKIILGGKNSASGKILYSSVEESCNVRGSLLLNPIKKGTDSGSETDVTRHDDVKSGEETAAASILLQPVSKPKIILMQSDDDDDEDFINIKADAEAEELLDAELPKETPQETSHGIVKTSTAALCSKDDGVVSSSAKDEQNISSAQWFQLSDRLGAKVTSGSVLDRLGVKKITNESNSPLLRITDRLSDKIIAPVSDRLGGKKMKCDDVKDSNQSASRRSISVLSQPEQHSVSVAQVTPTTVRTVSRMMNVDTETEQFVPKMMQRPLDEEETAGKDQIPRKRLLLSRVVAMHREAEEEEEEYDPANPAVGSVASVVRVKPRPKVPAALQANKNLILKAMAEAQKSVASAPKRVEPYERLDGLYTRKFRDKGSNKIAVTLPNRRMQPHKVSPVTEKQSDVERIVIPVKLDASRSISSVNLQQKIVIQVSSDKPASQDTVSPPRVTSCNVPEENVTENISSDYEEGNKNLMEVAAIVGREREEMSECQRANVYESESSPTELVSFPEVSRMESPQFVVTLDGLDPSVFEVHSRKKQRTYSVTMNSPNMDSESSLVEHKEKDINGSEGVQRQKRAASPILFQKAEDSDAAGSVTDTLKQKINERCKFWPACRSGDKCIYLHPTIPCKSFPNCKFGDKCLYIHPNCKFDASCTRRDCPFTHASPRNMSSATAAAARAPSSARRATQQVCRFFPKCSNVNCRFLHPKPCRYGRYCSKKTECTFLHEDIPPADKLKWYCPFRL